MATFNFSDYPAASAYQTSAQQQAVADRNRKPVIEDRDLLNSQLRDKSKRKRKKLPTILGDVMAQAAATVQTLLGA